MNSRANQSSASARVSNLRVGNVPDLARQLCRKGEDARDADQGDARGGNRHVRDRARDEVGAVRLVFLDGRGVREVDQQAIGLRGLQCTRRAFDGLRTFGITDDAGITHLDRARIQCMERMGHGILSVLAQGVPLDRLVRMSATSASGSRSTVCNNSRYACSDMPIGE